MRTKGGWGCSKNCPKLRDVIYRQPLGYRLNGGHDGGNDEHGGERDHDSIGEVVDGKVEGEITNSDQYESLEHIFNQRCLPIRFPHCIGIFYY